MPPPLAQKPAEERVAAVAAAKGIAVAAAEGIAVAADEAAAVVPAKAVRFMPLATRALAFGSGASGAVGTAGALLKGLADVGHAK